MFNPDAFKIAPKLSTPSDKAPIAAPKGDFHKLVEKPVDKSVDDEDDVADEAPEKTSVFSLSSTKGTAKTLDLPEKKDPAGQPAGDFKIPVNIQEGSLKAMKSIVPSLSPNTDDVPVLPDGKLNLDRSAINVPTLPDPKKVKGDPSIAEAATSSSNMAKPQSKTRTSIDRDSMDTDSTVPLSKLDEKPKVNVRAGMSEDRPDLAYLAPRAPDMHAVVVDKPVVSKSVPAPMQEIADQVVKSIDVLKSEGRTETIVTLNNGVFKDATVTITDFGNLKGQLNITFGNLNDAAMKIISRADNQNALEAALLSKGLTPTITITDSNTRQLGRGDKENQAGQESYPEEDK